jgi:hypothetical protein
MESQKHPAEQQALNNAPPSRPETYGRGFMCYTDHIDIERIWVAGYKRRDGRKVAGYWRRLPRTRRILCPDDLLLLI